ncbi:MAG: DUF58 domain-containing protein [Gammaproteobacteria bacterium]
MPKLFQRWRKQETKPASSAADETLLNSATCVTVTDLIALQRHARKLDLSRRMPARAQLAGNHQSRFRGRGMDYLESRTYQPGDDIRNMDWRVTARAGRPHTKLFQEERERPVVLLIDLGPAMFFATRGALKSVVAAQTATLIGWAAAAHGDRIGALLFNGGHHELEPRSGHRGVLQLIHALKEQADPLRGLANPAHSAGLNDALVRLRRIVRPGSLVIMLSDFHGLDDETGKHLARLRHHNDLLAIRICDPLEQAPPPPGRYAITDGTRTGLLDTQSGSGREAYASYFSDQAARIETLMGRNAVPLLQLSTENDVIAAMQRLFGRRAPAGAAGGLAA